MRTLLVLSILLVASPAVAEYVLSDITGSFAEFMSEPSSEIDLRFFLGDRAAVHNRESEPFKRHTNAYALGHMNDALQLGSDPTKWGVEISGYWDGDTSDRHIFPPNGIWTTGSYELGDGFYQLQTVTVDSILTGRDPAGYSITAIEIAFSNLVITPSPPNGNALDRHSLDYHIQILGVPEPSSAVLLLSCIGLVFVRHR